MNDLFNLSLSRLSPQEQFDYFLQGVNLVRTGKISKLYQDNLRCDVTCYTLAANKEDVVYKGVELCHFGFKDVYVNVEPQVGDAVIVFASVDHLETTVFDAVPKHRGYASPYSQPTMKAFCIEPSANTSAPLRLIATADGEVTLASGTAASEDEEPKDCIKLHFTADGNLDFAVGDGDTNNIEVKLESSGKVTSHYASDVAITADTVVAVNDTLAKIDVSNKEISMFNGKHKFTESEVTLNSGKHSFTESNAKICGGDLEVT